MANLHIVSLMLLLSWSVTNAQYPPPHTNSSQVGIDVGYTGPSELCILAGDVPRIKWITFGTNTTYVNDTGDTYYNSWGPDWNIWFTSDDSAGIQGACLPNGSNIVLNKATGQDVSNLQPITVNCLKAEWGLHGDDQGHGDGGSWKTTGLTWLDSVLYLWVARNIRPQFSNDELRQSAQNSCLLKSTNAGLTFEGSNQSACFDNPMFPGRLFGTPSFIQYGRNGEAGPHGSDVYAYALSNDGSWDNGDSVRLGRVLRSQIGNLNSTDWDFFAGSPSNITWTKNISQSVPILSQPNELSSAGVVYNPYLDEYILSNWYFPNRTGFGVYPSTLYPTVWTFYASRKPWGPYRLVSNTSWPNAAWWNPVIVNKFWGFDGKSGTVVTSGGGYSDGSSYLLSTINFSIETFW